MSTPTPDVQRLLQENANLQKDLHDVTQQRDDLTVEVGDITKENEALREEILRLHEDNENSKTELIKTTQAKALLEISNSEFRLESQKAHKELLSLREDRKVLDNFARTLNAHNEAQRRGKIGNYPESVLLYVSSNRVMGSREEIMARDRMKRAREEEGQGGGGDATVKDMVSLFKSQSSPGRATDDFFHPPRRPIPLNLKRIPKAKKQRSF